MRSVPKFCGRYCSCPPHKKENMIREIAHLGFHIQVALQTHMRAHTRTHTHTYAQIPLDTLAKCRRRFMSDYANHLPNPAQVSLLNNCFQAT